MSSPTIPTKIQSRPLNLIHDSAYAAMRPRPTDRITDGTVIRTEFRKKVQRSSWPGPDDRTLR